MILKWTEQALQDIDDIMLFIAKDNVERAISFTDELMEQPNRLIDNPYIGVRYSEDYDENIRLLVYKGYNIIYQVEKENIIVHVVYHHSKIPTIIKMK